MPFNPQNPIEWINEITQNEPPFVNSLCKSLYWEELLVRWPQRASVCQWGMTRLGQIGIDEMRPDAVVNNMPTLEQMLRLDDTEYQNLVRQEDPEALNPGAQNFWAFAVAAFKRCGGNVPQPMPGADGWHLRHLYAGEPALPNGALLDATPDGNHYTQSAGMVAVNPIVYHLVAQHPCIANTLRARAFTKFQYDPANYFAPEAAHDNCGFVV